MKIYIKLFLPIETSTESFFNVSSSHNKLKGTVKEK